MKHTIFGLCQKTLCELEIDLTEALLYRYILDFIPHMKFITVNDELYFWVDYDYFIKNLPILNVGKKSISDRMKKERLSNLFDKLDKAGATRKYVKRVASGTYIYVAIDKAVHQRLTHLCTPKPAPLRHPGNNRNAKTPGITGMHIKDNSSINNSSISQSNDLNSDIEPELKNSLDKKTDGLTDKKINKKTKEQTDGLNDRQNDFIQQYVLQGYQRKYVLIQMDKLKTERERRRNKGLEKITNEKVYLDRMISNTGDYDVFLAEQSLPEEKKPFVRGYQTPETAAKESDDCKKDLEARKNEKQIRQNDTAFHEMLRNPDGELYKKCFDLLVPFVKRKLTQGENNQLTQISMYNAYKKLTTGLRQTG